jgi:hypothetical protein
MFRRFATECVHGPGELFVLQRSQAVEILDREFTFITFLGNLCNSVQVRNTTGTA